MINIMAKLWKTDLQRENMGMIAIFEATKKFEWDNRNKT